MQANSTALNGKELSLNADGSAPVLAPVTAGGSQVAVPALSVSYVVFK